MPKSTAASFDQSGSRIGPKHAKPQDASGSVETRRTIRLCGDKALTHWNEDRGAWPAVAASPSLASYHLLPSVRGDLLFKLGRLAEARGEFERAAALAKNVRERALLVERAAACGVAGA
jgi:hypothetical protein